MRQFFLPGLTEFLPVKPNERSVNDLKEMPTLDIVDIN